MPVDLSIVESTTELGQTVVEVILESASAPGPAGPGVPVGGTDGQVLTKASATDYDTAWEDPTGGGGGGAPTDADYLVGTANGSLSAEIVVGTTPGGELGGTWASPTVDATHSGSTHAAVQAAAEATAAAALGVHAADTTAVHGIADTSALALTANHPSNATFNDHSARHENGGADEISLAGLDGTPTDLQTHLDDATAAHAGSAISVDSTNLSGTGTTVQASLEELDNLLDDHSARHEDGGADEITIQGLAGTPTELTNHLNDASDAHDASAISFTPAVSIAATDVQAAIEEVASEAGGGGGTDVHYETRSSNTILGTADKGKVIDITATITQTFEADETLGDGWWVTLRNATDDGTTIVTLNPAGTETIDGLTTVTMYSGEARLIICNGAGANFNSVLLQGGFAVFTADGNFTVPHGITEATVDIIGAGGGGGGARGGAVSTVRQAGSGGGGGGRVMRKLAAPSLGNPGDTIAIDVGTGGGGGTGGSSDNGTAGTTGGVSTFGSLITAGGGGGGSLGTTTGTRNGGGGGGYGESGTVGSTTSRGGGNAIVADATGLGAGYGSAGAGGGGAIGLPAEYGGGAGSGASSTASQTGLAGGTSLAGGGGGGGGGGVTNANPGVERNGEAGGASGAFNATVGGGGGAGGAAPAGVGSNGAAGDLRICGAGGGGGGGENSGTGGAGGDGGAPGGGGGGGGAGTSLGGAGGAGARGECRVFYS